MKHELEIISNGLDRVRNWLHGHHIWNRPEAVEETEKAVDLAETTFNLAFSGNNREDDELLDVCLEAMAYAEEIASTQNAWFDPQHPAVVVVMGMTPTEICQEWLAMQQARKPKPRLGGKL